MVLPITYCLSIALDAHMLSHNRYGTWGGQQAIVWGKVGVGCRFLGTCKFGGVGIGNYRMDLLLPSHRFLMTHALHRSCRSVCRGASILFFDLSCIYIYIYLYGERYTLTAENTSENLFSLSLCYNSCCDVVQTFR